MYKKKCPFFSQTDYIIARHKGLTHISYQAKAKSRIQKSRRQNAAESRPAPQVRDMVEGWLARARNPASRMEPQLHAAEEKIKQMEQESKEETKIGEIRHQEQTIKI